jgi:hypothetical protein
MNVCGWRKMGEKMEAEGWMEPGGWTDASMRDG